MERKMATQFVIDIPAGLTITQMVELGKYNWVNENVKTKFELDPTLVGKWECELVEPKKSITSESASKLCSDDGWMPAQVDHLLMFGSTYPKLQRQNWIVGLGSSCQNKFDHRVVPVLFSDDRSRDLDLSYWGIDWNSDCRFLRVRRLGT